MGSRHVILVTGGAGYVGSVLVPKLLGKGHEVRVLDLFIYGDQPLAPYRQNENLREIKGDIRDIDLLRAHLQGCDVVIHLACISNDPSCDLDPALTRSINYDAFIPLLEECRQASVKRFIFASSSSVYGISQDPHVTEDHPRVPITDYNRYKALCEDILAAYQSDGFATTTIRPATICGYSPRLRLDLTVNILTNHGFNKGRITVFGGDQYRPNLHIEDVTDLYTQLLDEPIERISGKTYNAGYQNQTVSAIARVVKGTIEAKYPHKGSIEILTTLSDDIRSYQISSERIARELGFRPKHTIEDAVTDLCSAFNTGKVPNSLESDIYYNVKLMTRIGLQ